MLIETTELTLPHVGLGALSETALLAMFATAQAHRLTAGCNATLDEVVDADGAPLYPAYFWLHLRVPPARRLELHRLWRRVEIGVDVRRYGRLLLESTYTAGAEHEVPRCPEEWDPERFPVMHAASMFSAQSSTGTTRPSAPREGTIAELPVLHQSPAALERFRAIRVRGTFSREPWPLHAKPPVAYQLLPGRDLAPGKNLLFATYITVMDAAEHELLAGTARWPPFPLALLNCRSILEREVFFVQHADGGTVLTDVRARIERCATNVQGIEPELVAAAILTGVFELYDAKTRVLLAVGRVRKLLLVPRACASLLAELERWCEHSNSPLE